MDLLKVNNHKLTDWVCIMSQAFPYFLSLAPFLLSSLDLPLFIFMFIALLQVHVSWLYRLSRPPHRFAFICDSN